MTEKDMGKDPPLTEKISWQDPWLKKTPEKKSLTEHNLF